MERTKEKSSVESQQCTNSSFDPSTDIQYKMSVTTYIYTNEEFYTPFQNQIPN